MAMSTPIGIRAAFLEALKTKSGLAAASMLGFLLLLAVLVPIIAPYDVVNSGTNRPSGGAIPNLSLPNGSRSSWGSNCRPRISILPEEGPAGFREAEGP